MNWRTKGMYVDPPTISTNCRSAGRKPFRVMTSFSIPAVRSIEPLIKDSNSDRVMVTSPSTGATLFVGKISDAPNSIWADDCVERAIFGQLGQSQKAHPQELCRPVSLFRLAGRSENRPSSVQNGERQFFDDSDVEVRLREIVVACVIVTVSSPDDSRPAR